MDTLREHGNFDEFIESVKPARLFALTTKGRHCYAQVDFKPGDRLAFGPESRGLPRPMLDALPEPQQLYVPMRPESRSLNLFNAVALVLYEAWRQNGFAGGSLDK